ncbi:MAG: hypothetical protein LBP24_00570 [Coriobacteriales bacterium]|jgi:hypothetical protein|nr:hypothetical protein [Coriobacteriales bacterium]
MAERDFSQDAFNYLAEVIGSLQSEKFSADPLWEYFEDVSGIGEFFEKINELQRTKALGQENALRTLHAVFTNVHQCDTDSKTHTAPIIEELAAFKTLIAGMKATVSSSGGVCALAGDFYALSQRLDASSKALRDIIRKKLAWTDANGNTVYDWDAIEALVDKPALNITEAEYRILASLFEGMDPEAISIFLQRSAEPWTSTANLTTDSPLYGPWVGTVDTRDSLCDQWVFDSIKLKRMAAYLGEDYMAVLESGDNARLADISARLELLLGIGSLYIGDDEGKKYPDIRVELASGEKNLPVEYVVHYPVDVNLADHSREIHFCSDYGGDTAYLLGRILDKRTQEHLSLGADEVVSGVTFVAGFIPPLSIASNTVAGIQTTIGIIQNRGLAEYHSDLTEMSGSCSKVYERFTCITTLVTGGDNPHNVSLAIYPTEETFERIAQFNEELANSNGAVDPNKHNLKYPITFEDIQLQPTDVRELLDDLKGHNAKSHGRVVIDAGD